PEPGVRIRAEGVEACSNERAAPCASAGPMFSCHGQNGCVSRTLERLGALYAIGSTRIGGSAEEDAAHSLTAGWMRDAGLEVEVDAAGNLFGRRGAGDLWVGSHLDTV